MLTVSIFNGIDLGVPLNSNVLTAVLALMLALWMIFTLVVRYHWNRYGASATENFKMDIIYFSGSAFLVGGMVLFFLLYNFSGNI